MTARTADNAVRLLIVGPPGAGKGTQATGLARAYGVPAISTGDIFRSNIKNGTDLGLKVQSIIESGSLVPDSLTNELVRDRIAQDDCNGGFLLDGYPRTVEQVDFLTDHLGASGAAIDAVVRLIVDTEVVVDRLRNRAVKEGRVDDTETVIRNRLDVYARETEPIVAIYGDRGVLVDVDGEGRVDEVAKRILDSLAEQGVRR
ncbi:adenylate kinase [Pseudoclavibacter endophyticus]|uniref:Adenylate kinase n=1 Tax=Pseudoclavibacter endophyticus TaxID=1778590 RepID=A0A6H9WG02_9MICO|nr:adenylate kinase [Pseudoclavibacter endophyticus]KAB1647854.1 adenylate kinase [Pseudoclavibacter endophyticus]GGA73352.1 adenylate kinase [Pseudoclavibacter endophyticus]